MSVESVEYISDLEQDRPRGSDRISQGDDHIRNIKKGLKQTFPNVTGEVKASHEEMNYLVGLTGPIKDELDAGANDLSQLEADVAKNTADIATNAAGIASNDAELADHESRIAANTQGISFVDQNKAEKTYVDQQNAAQDSVIADKADKSYVDSENNDQDSVISTKADKSDTYTKAQIDVLIAEASKGGVMIKIVQQPTSAGNFSLSSYIDRGGQGYSKVMGSETSTLTLSVPNNMVFCLQGITAHAPSATIRMSAGNIVIDGVDVNGGLTTSLEWASGEDHVWPNNQNCAPIMVESSVVLRDVYSSGQGSPQIILQGYFVEA